MLGGAAAVGAAGGGASAGVQAMNRERGKTAKLSLFMDPTRIVEAGDRSGKKAGHVPLVSPCPASNPSSLGDSIVPSVRLQFDGVMGRLAGILETPSSEPLAYALFAHCFTCSKDFKAAVRIARALCARGFAVLRFDFTGLGESEGEFTESSFSSNVDDLVAAAAFLDLHYAPPSLMVGHSLGGAAVLAAAHRVSSAKALATIASPAGTEHLQSALLHKAPELASGGEAEVEIAGRAVRVRSRLLDDLRAHNIRDCVRKLDRALMIFHSPIDSVVGIDQAAALFQAARHPKSFVSLDNADHLLIRDPRDAEYVGEVLASWASRYVFTPQTNERTEP